MPLALITLGLIAQDAQFSSQLHTWGQIDVLVGVIWLILAVVVGIASAVTSD